MAVDTPFAVLIEKLRNGDPEVAHAVFDRFALRLVRVARNRLSPLVRQKIDPEDVIQSVFRSFFRKDFETESLPESWDSLWGLLTVITLRKCGRWTEHFRTAKRNIYRELSYRPETNASLASWEALAKDPTPEDAAILTELVQQMMMGLVDYERTILEMSLQGHSVEEISVHVGYTRRTVQRVLKRVREGLENERDGHRPTH